MTDKCWFVLRHQHYPPPEFPANGVGNVKGPLCPGHLIPDLKSLDNVINPQGPEEYPPDMPVHKRTAHGLVCSTTKEGGLDFSLEAEVPVAAAIGTDVHASTSKAFQKSVQNHWRFSRLDTFILQVTQSYVEDSMDQDAVAQYVAKHKVLGISRSTYMITGVMIARGASLESVAENSKGVSAGLGSQIPDVAGVSGEVKYAFSHGFELAADNVDDFVWAVRLAKISKGVLDDAWNYRSVSKGATFDNSRSHMTPTDIRDLLQKDGLDTFEVVPRDDCDEFLVVL